MFKFFRFSLIALLAALASAPAFAAPDQTVSTDDTYQVTVDRSLRDGVNQRTQYTLNVPMHQKCGLDLMTHFPYVASVDVGSGQTKTSELNTGINFSVLRQVENRVHFTFERRDLIALRPFTHDGATIQLPEVRVASFLQDVVLNPGQKAVVFQQGGTTVSITRGGALSASTAQITGKDTYQVTLRAGLKILAQVNMDGKVGQINPLQVSHSQAYVASIVASEKGVTVLTPGSVTEGVNGQMAVTGDKGDKAAVSYAFQAFGQDALAQDLGHGTVSLAVGETTRVAMKANYTATIERLN
jgi:hypothetical protein